MPARTWSPEEAIDILEQLYERFLRRQPDPSGLATYGERLVNGTMSVRDVVLALVTSDEYLTRHNSRFGPEYRVRSFYWEILGRGPDPSGLKHYIAEAQSAHRHYPGAPHGRDEGIVWVATTLVRSDEYSHKFGDDRVPSDC